MKTNYLILASLFLLAACLPSTVKTDSSFPTYLMMNSQDLPEHWKVDSFTKMDVEGAESYNIEFSKPNISTEPVLVQHQLSIYPTEDTAKQAFPDWEKQWFPTANRKTPDGFDFQPKAKNDSFRLACLSEKVNGQPILLCNYLHQHSNIITLVLAKLDGDNLNLQQLINAIEILDIRLQQN